jgi:hypothetical protein
LKNRMRFKIGFIVLIIASICVAVYDASSQEEAWDIFSTRYCTVFYEKGVNIRAIDRRINLSFCDFYKPLDPEKEKEDFSVKAVVSGKLDSIFRRVEEILDMYPPKVHVNINIYKTTAGLDEEYKRLFDKPNQAISFYIYKTNTIYTTEKFISESILAHEMAHCIVDHYFVILPPVKIQEMLAVYADVHLKD